MAGIMYYASGQHPDRHVWSLPTVPRRSPRFLPPDKPLDSGTKKSIPARNVTVMAKRTSMRLEPSLWSALEEVGKREGRSVDEVCDRIVETMLRNYGTGKPPSFTAAVRMFLVSYYREAATATGHRQAQHGAGQFEAVVERAFADPPPEPEKRAGRARKVQAADPA